MYDSPRRHALVVLLDLACLFVNESLSPTHGFDPADVIDEHYQKWLIDLLRPHSVILFADRPDMTRTTTINSLRVKCDWEPLESHFLRGGLPIVNTKAEVLDRVLKSTPPNQVLGLDNDRDARRVYEANGIRVGAVQLTRGMASIVGGV